MDSRAERRITSFMRERDDPDDAAMGSAGSSASGAEFADGGDGDDAAVTGSEGPDERAARSELAHMFSDALEPEGSNVEELDGSNAEAAPKISAQMNVPQAGRLYKRAVVSQ